MRDRFARWGGSILCAASVIACGDDPSGDPLAAWIEGITVANRGRAADVSTDLAAAAAPSPARGPSTGEIGATVVPDILELTWEDLVPADYRFQPEELLGEISGAAANLDDADPRATRLMDKLREVWSNAPVREDLDDKDVRLPGFVVPLLSEANIVRDFLLVPYFGACIHVPPPPANQIVHVHSERGYPLEQLFDAVWVTGRLKTERVNSDMGDAGYTLQAVLVEPYE